MKTMMFFLVLSLISSIYASRLMFTNQVKATAACLLAFNFIILGLYFGIGHELATNPINLIIMASIEFGSVLFWLLIKYINKTGEIIN